LANTKQQRKRVLTAQRQRLENLRYKSSIKTHFKRLQTSVDAGEGEAAADIAKKLNSTIDKAAAHNAPQQQRGAQEVEGGAASLPALKPFCLPALTR